MAVPVLPEVATEPPESSMGVDLTLIVEMLRMTPDERLRQNDRAAALVKQLRDAFANRAHAQPR